MIPQHRAMMLAAFVTSGLFLISYLTYHLSEHLITRFQGEGMARTMYFAILISHSVLAVAVPPMAIITLFRGLKMNVEKHRALARWTLPIWLYVSFTGVAVYFMLYHIYA
jgi:putative membrane protein